MHLKNGFVQFTEDDLKVLYAKPSELLATALADLHWCEQRKDFQVDMAGWCEWRDRHSPVCHVCLAGSILGRRIANPESYLALTLHRIANHTVAHRLRGLNCFRIGQLRQGLDYMGILVPAHLENVDVPNYHFQRDAFFEAMEGLVVTLRDAGL